MRCATTCLLTAMLITASATPAQTYQIRPIRWVVTYPPGGPTDVVARAIGAKLTEAWGQQIVIYNRAGAGGVIGTDIAAKAGPDGYTLLFGTSAGLTINPALNSKLPYDAVKDFAPVSLLVLNPQILVVHPAVPVNSVKELIALAKARPGQLNYASVGLGSPNHMGMELLKALTGIDIVHVPYKGTGPAITDLLGGQVQVMFNSMPSVIPLVASGKLKGLAVGSVQRSPAVPDIPTVAESGVPGYEILIWNGLVTHAATPPAIVARLHRELARILGAPELVTLLASDGSRPFVESPAAFGAFLKKEIEKWARVVREARITDG